MKVEFGAFWGVHSVGRLLVKGSGSGGWERHGRLFLRKLSTRDCVAKFLIGVYGSPKRVGLVEKLL